MRPIVSTKTKSIVEGNAMLNHSRRFVLALVCCLFVSATALADPAQDKGEPSAVLKVAVYTDFAPFSANGAGIDVDLAKALADKMGMRLSLLPFKAGDDLNDDLRNMVWKGHYLGYGPADVMLHVPVDKRLMTANEQVLIFAPYYHDTVRLVRSAKTVPNFDGIDSLLGKKIGVDGDSISSAILLGEQNGKFREAVKIYGSAIEALEKLKAGEIDAVMANVSEIESVFKGSPEFPVEEVAFARLPRQGWNVGMAVKKDEADLAKQLQDATNALFASGDMEKIFSKYGVRVVKP
jgi:ABC-type amino acid transport substrate-binding protein